jgi:two-component system, LytTR family, sensor kinase
MSERAPSPGLLPQSGVGRGVLLAVFWTIVGVIFALPNLRSGNAATMLAASLTQWWAWGLVAPLVVAADRRLPFSDRQLARRLAAHLALSLVFTVIYVYLMAALRATAQLGPWQAVFTTTVITNALGGMYLWGWLVYWVILGGWLALNYYERFVTSELRSERLERRFSEARLNNLRLQLDPHFLFNALNTVSSQVERDPKLARRMIEHLGDLLRLSLDSKDRQEVALVEELAFLDHYLAIQRIRFGDHLRIATDVAPDVRHAAVPSLILQPLVENAVRHGLASRASGGTVTIDARAAGDRLEIRVQDDGVGLPAGWQLESGAGVGLSVTRDRIAELHPNGSSRFAVVPRIGGGTSVEISLPLRVVGEVLTASAIPGMAGAAAASAEAAGASPGAPTSKVSA